MAKNLRSWVELASGKAKKTTMAGRGDRPRTVTIPNTEGRDKKGMCNGKDVLIGKRHFVAA